MLDTKTIRILVSEKEKKLIRKMSIEAGFRDVSSYVRHNLIKSDIFSLKLNNVIKNLRSEYGPNKRY